MPIPEYADNLFIDRLPAILSIKQLQSSFDRPPLLVGYDRTRPPEERLHIVLRLLRYSQPTLAGRELSRRIELMIRQGYIGRNPLTSDWTRFINVCSAREAAAKHDRAVDVRRPADELLGGLTPVSDTSISTLAAGPPGVGKTHSVATSLARYAQVIYHTEPFVLAQIVWLRVECPPNGSLVALCRFFFAAVDKALNDAGVSSDLAREYKTASLGVLLTGMARVANLHGIGLLVIDEIQHVRVAHAEGSALLNFLVTLRNSIGIPLLLVGTMSALAIVQRTFRDARRADGLGSILFDRLSAADTVDQLGLDGTEKVERYGADFEQFVRRMWRWQYTNVQSPLTVEILNSLFDETQGIIDLIVKLFILIQLQLINRTSALSANDETITPELIAEVAKQSFNAVRPFIKALRDNDRKALENCEDLINFHEWFANYVAGVGMANDEFDGKYEKELEPLPPMVRAGSLVPDVVDSLLQGFGIDPKNRARLMARHAGLVEAGDLSGLVAALQTDARALSAVEPEAKPVRSVRQPHIAGDLRAEVDGVTNSAEAARCLGLQKLDTIFEE